MTYWSFTPAEQAALQTWVQNGGGIISLTGYVSTDPNEIVPENQLLGFSGLTYVYDDIITSDNPSGYGYCVGEAYPITFNNPASPIYSSTLQQVGAFYGFPISIGTSASNGAVAASGDATGNPALPGTFNYGVSITGGPNVGNGRIFMWMDEWVTYTSQWAEGSSTCVNAGSAANCAGHWGSDVFQVGQFWYNVLSWVSNQSCFKLVATGITLH